MASHPPAQVFPAPFLQQVAPVRTARIFNMPVICIPPGHQTMLTSALQPSQVANIIPGQIPTTRGVVMAMGQTVLSPQQVVVPSSLPCSSTSPQEIRVVDVHKHPVRQVHKLPRELVRQHKPLTIESCDNVPIVEKMPEDKALSPVSAASHLKQKEVESVKDTSDLSGKEREDFVETEVDSGEKGDNLNSSVITYIIESGDSPSEDEDDFDEMEETKRMDEEDNQRVKSLPMFPNAATQMPANSSNSKVPVQYSNVIMPYGFMQNQIILSPTHLQQNSNVLQSSQALGGLTPAVYCQQVLVSQPSGGLPHQQPLNLKPISISSIKPILPGNENKAAGSTKVCAHCGTTETPLWRRTSEGRFICNACGIYWKTNSCPRPVPRANSKRPRTTKTRDACCANCGTTVTSLWRRDQEGQTVCNACGLYYKLHKESRPIKLKKDHIKTRKRRCRGEELDRNTALHNCHLPSNYSSLQSIATSQGSYVMMSSTPTRDQHSPTSDNSVAMVTPQSRPSMQQTPYTEV